MQVNNWEYRGKKKGRVNIVDFYWWITGFENIQKNEKRQQRKKDMLCDMHTLVVPTECTEGHAQVFFKVMVFFELYNLSSLPYFVRNCRSSVADAVISVVPNKLSLSYLIAALPLVSCSLIKSSLSTRSCSSFSLTTSFAILCVVM